MSNNESGGQPSFFHTVKVILWAFLGVRKESGYDEDVKRVPASHAIIIGVIGVILFIALLVTIVRIVISAT